VKNRIAILFIVVMISLLITPTQVFAFTGVSGNVEDTVTGDPWAWGGYVYLVNQTTGELAGQGSFTGSSFNIDYSVQPSNNDQIMVYVFPNSGPEGTPPYVFSGPHNEVSAIPAPLPVGTMVLQSGPNSIELVDFSVTPQSNVSTWLPFILLVGSVILVGGAVTIIRKRQA
jgi:hypothetical protein